MTFSLKYKYYINLKKFSSAENLEAIEKGQAGLHYGKKISTELTPCIPNKTDTTPMKADVSCIQNPADCTQIRIERYNSNIHVEKGTPVKIEFSPTVRDISQVRRQDYSTPNSKSHMYAKIDPTDLSFLEVPVTLNSDALADIVLQVIYAIIVEL